MSEPTPEQRIVLICSDGTEMRQLLPVDAPDYLAAIEQGPSHLNQFGEDIATNNPDVETVRRRIQESLDRGDLRFGIWPWIAAVGRRVLVGHVGLSFEEDGSVSMGYWVSKPHTRQGIATRGVKTVLDHVFQELPVNEVVARIHPENEASWRTAEKVGFERGSIDAKGRVLYTAFRGSA